MRNVTPAQKHLNFCDGGSVWGLFVVDYYHCFACCHFLGTDRYILSMQSNVDCVIILVKVKEDCEDY